ncbi:MAG: hypothetical protein O2782_17400, partial [bacterium]|nr:hypothetical protein [bacterium]
MVTLRVAIMAIAAAVSAGPVSAAGAQATQVTQHYSARAVDLESGELLYSEHHTESLHNGEISTSRVVYVDRAGDTLATKTMQFAAAPTRPAFFIEYHIEGTAEGVYTVGDSLVLERRRGLSTESETKTVAINEPVVIDGGFDHAVRQHWDRLGAGKSFAFDFPLPDR